jgi:hypothetical protein
VLKVDAFGDIDFRSSGDVAIGYAPAEDEVVGDPPAQEVGPAYVETTVTGHTITVRAVSDFIIVDGAAVESHTGMVSNDPPLLRPTPDNPKEVLVPGQRVHTITGQMGGNQDLKNSVDNLERGRNFTLSLFWSDLKSTIIYGIHAGDVFELEVGEAGEVLSFNITHEGEVDSYTLVNDHDIQIIRSDVTHDGEGYVGPIHYTLKRGYSLAYLQTVETTVETWLVMTNDVNIFLDDVRPINLNETSTIRGIKVASEFNRGSEPIPDYLNPPPPRELEMAAAIEELRTAPLAEAATRYEELRPPSEEGAEKLRLWYLVRVLPSGKEDARYPLSEDIATDPVKLFQRLREMGLPDGRYRIYLEELGFPRRLVYEFYKSGNSFGDPVRERGPGANPMQEGKPAPAPPAKQGTSSWSAPSEASAVAREMLGPAETTLIVGPEAGTDARQSEQAGSKTLNIGEPIPHLGEPLSEEDEVQRSRVPETNEASGAPVLALGAWLWGSLPACAQLRGAKETPPASKHWCARSQRHDWNQRIDDALESCTRRDLTRGARLGRRLRNRTKVVG